MRLFILSIMLLGCAAVWAQDEPAEPKAPKSDDAPSADSVKTMSGMSILGNEEAPKALVIVPWKSSKLGDGLGISNALDETPRPVDREVFMRELHFYQLRSGSSD
jgi:hypothetical protein